MSSILLPEEHYCFIRACFYFSCGDSKEKHLRQYLFFNKSLQKKQLNCWNISIRAIKQSSGCAAVRLRCDRRSHSSVVVRRSVSVCSCVCLFKIKNKDLPGVLYCVSCQLHLRRFSYKNKPKLVNSCHPLRVKRHKKDVEFNVELNSMYFHIYFQWTLIKPSERRQSP